MDAGPFDLSKRQNVDNIEISSKEIKEALFDIDSSKSTERDGGRGLRQGDPISLYHFTLVMEVFNMIMIKNISKNGKFKYHHGCNELKLTHMCFEDDLMVLCNGDIKSLKVVKKFM
nr:RNA-directed DNA polymerase, eukaryota, reverse transcriptase zinc-binding domain protein [Tanacetum cinerariifolium]